MHWDKTVGKQKPADLDHGCPSKPPGVGTQMAYLEGGTLSPGYTAVICKGTHHHTWGHTDTLVYTALGDTLKCTAHSTPGDTGMGSDPHTDACCRRPHFGSTVKRAHQAGLHPWAKAPPQVPLRATRGLEQTLGSIPGGGSLNSALEGGEMGEQRPRKWRWDESLVPQFPLL